MTSKEQIFARVRRAITVRLDMPDTRLDAIAYPDKAAQFATALRGIGGEAVTLDADDDLDRLLRSLYPGARSIASNLPGLAAATLDPDALASPRLLDGVDVAVVEGLLGVAENGAVWIPRNVRERALYFIVEHLVILLPRDRIVDNMHEAYRHVTLDGLDFGLFISGPSKTADIEQSLVIGAHGARALTVILR
jgi:L-lactate dehydrogenase complex protein LldG